jgi:hypothetical protein
LVKHDRAARCKVRAAIDTWISDPVKNPRGSEDQWQVRATAGARDVHGAQHLG